MAFQYKRNFKNRIKATIIDYVIFSIPVIGYVTFFGHNNAEGNMEVSGLMTLPVFSFWIIYFFVIEAFYGATVGHQKR